MEAVEYIILQIFLETSAVKYPSKYPQSVTPEAALEPELTPRGRIYNLSRLTDALADSPIFKNARTANNI